MSKIDFGFERFFSQEDNKPGTISISDNPSINSELLDTIITNGTINNYSDEQLFELLSTNLTGFLLNIFDRKDQRFIKMIISERFLRVLIQFVNSAELDYRNKTYINRLCYDYLALDDKSKDAATSELIYHLAKITNKVYIPNLIGRGIPEKIACYVVLSRFSSSDEFVNVKRMNYVILSANIDFTEQMIVDIYQVLFERVSQLFEATMLDTLNGFYDDSISERYSLITLAVLDILNSLTSEQIRRVLEDYTRLYHVSYEFSPVRCDLRCLSNDYIRIRTIVEDMNNYGIMVP